MNTGYCFRRFTRVLWFPVLLGLVSNEALPATNEVPLSVYVVSREKIDGGRFIDTPGFPKLGYIPAAPAMVINRLESVVADVSRVQGTLVDKDGKETVEPIKEQAALNIRMRPEDAKKFTAVTEKALGKTVLLMLGDKPLIAPRVMAPIDTPSLLITFGDKMEKTEAKTIEDALKKLTK